MATLALCPLEGVGCREWKGRASAPCSQGLGLGGCGWFGPRPGASLHCPLWLACLSARETGTCLVFSFLKNVTREAPPWPCLSEVTPESVPLGPFTDCQPGPQSVGSVQTGVFLSCSSGSISPHPRESRASFSHSSRPPHLCLICFSVEALSSHPFTGPVCPRLPPWVHPV